LVTEGAADTSGGGWRLYMIDGASLHCKQSPMAVSHGVIIMIIKRAAVQGYTSQDQSGISHKRRFLFVTYSWRRPAIVGMEEA
jgi:hypothetical protein